jgi:hypothetical protein
MGWDTTAPGNPALAGDNQEAHGGAGNPQRVIKM